MMRSAKISIIVLNRNGGEDLPDCLESIFENVYTDFDVILVDNASEDDSLNLAKLWASGKGEVKSKFVSPSPRAKAISWQQLDLDRWGELEHVDSETSGEEHGTPDLTIISSKINLGFAGGHDLGISLALKRSASYVLLLNSDMVVDREFLTPLVDEIRKPHVGAVGPVVLDYADESVIWQAGGRVYPRRAWARRGFAGREVKHLDAEPSEVSYLPGCAVLIDREALESVGPLDRDYFVYFEDTDWLTRARALGWKVVLVPASRVWHRETYLSRLSKLAYSSYYFARNRLLFTRKNYPRYLPLALAWSVRYGILDNILRRRWRDLGMALMGIHDFVTGKKGRRDSLSHRVGSMPNMLVFGIDYKPQPGGIAEHGHKVACHLKQAGAWVAVLGPARGDHRRFDENQPFRTYRVPHVPGLDWVLFFFAAFYIIIKHQIRIVYVTTSYPCALICRVLRLVVCFDFTVTIHGHEVVYSAKVLRQRIKAALKPLQIWAIAGARRVFAVSRFTRRSLIDAGVGERKVVTIYNGVDLEDFEGVTGVRAIVDRFRLGGKCIILTIARLDTHKGHDVVIQAMPSVLKKVPNAVYVIAGEGRMRSDLHELAARCQVRDNVIFTGLLPRDEVLALLKACDVFVMVSRIEESSAEGFGIVFLEAGAFSKPVVGGRSGGIPDAVEDGVSGLLVDPHDPDEAAAALTRILLDGDLAARLGRQGRTRVESHFTWDAVIKRIKDGLNTTRR